MTDLATIDTEILKLQEELEQFQDLQTKLDVVRVKAEQLTAKMQNETNAIKAQAKGILDAVESKTDQAIDQCHAAVQNMEESAQKTLETTALTAGEKYAILSLQNQKQFQKLSEAWVAQSAIAKESSSGIVDAAEQVKAGAARLGELSKRLRAMAESEEALPVRLDKIDSTIASSLLVSQGLQARFDSMKADLGKMTEEIQGEMKRHASTIVSGNRDSFGKLTTKISEDIDKAQVFLADKMAGAQQHAEDAEHRVIGCVTEKTEGGFQSLQARLDAAKADLEKMTEGIQGDIAASESRIIQSLAEKTNSAIKVAEANNAAIHKRLDKMMQRSVFIASVLLVFLLASLGVGIALLLHKPQ